MLCVIETRLRNATPTQALLTLFESLHALALRSLDLRAHVSLSSSSFFVCVDRFVLIVVVCRLSRCLCSVVVASACCRRLRLTN
jgi:hypothetical protein